VGSTEFVENYEDILNRNALLYLNADLAVSGSELFEASGVPSLIPLLSKVITDEVKLPNGSAVSTLWDGQFYTLGSGSDYACFLQRIGVPALDVRYIGDEYEAVYHSNYDSFYWYTHFGDPDFSFHASLTKVFGAVGKNAVRHVSFSSNTYPSFTFQR
jgi:N-acetylated-alpha-linked acidic dipeptidase